MLKKTLIILCLGFIVALPDVSATTEQYYKNDYGVTLNKEEYDFLEFMFWNGCQAHMTKADYEKFINSDIMSGEVDSKIYEEPTTRATTIEDSNRTFKISKSCTTNCFISVTLTWKNNPITRSYDVMGAYLDGTTLENTPSTVIKSTGSSSNITDIKRANNGFGVSMLLPKYGNNIIINQNFRVKKSGTVYASYQHAKNNISYGDSKNYTFSKSGYGQVFQFSGTPTSIYDRFGGINISL